MQLKKLQELSIQRSSETLEILKRHSEKDPALAKFFSENPILELDNMSRAHMLGDSDSTFETKEMRALRLDAELFYYLAHRLCVCLSLLPEMKDFECKKIAIIRNQLIEHPEKSKSGVLLPSFGYDFKVGPVIKAMRDSDKAELHIDAGFIPNCNTFIVDIASALESAIMHIKKPN
jgi:hypothetical protein